MEKSLAEELDDAFRDVDLGPADILEPMEHPKSSHEMVTEDTRRVEDVVPQEHVAPLATRQSNSPAIANADPDSPATLMGDDQRSPIANTISNATLRQTPRKSNFVEDLSPVNSSSQPVYLKDCRKLTASKHNRELIDRNADGFFKMDTMPSVTDVRRRVQQSDGIAALQRTLVPTKVSDAASSSTRNSHASSSTTVDSVKRPSALRQVTFAKSSGRKPDRSQASYPYTTDRPRATSRFSLARDLVAAGHRKKLSEPSAPARFVRLPTDPVVHFKRSFGESGLKLRIPEPEPDEYEGDDSGSVTSLPDVDSAGDLKFRPHDSEARDVALKFEFGIPRAFISNQCLESSCPMRWAHAKGPYHHMGNRHNKIMTGLFGHSNPPPEIWNAYRNMVHLTCDGEVISPDGRPEPKAEDDLVIAFAMLHYGGLNGMSGVEFHRRYAGQHLSSRVALRSRSTSSSEGCCGSHPGTWK